MIQIDTQSADRPMSQSTFSNTRTNSLKQDFENKNVFFTKYAVTELKFTRQRKISDQILPITT